MRKRLILTTGFLVLLCGAEYTEAAVLVPGATFTYSSVTEKIRDARRARAEGRTIPEPEPEVVPSEKDTNDEDLTPTQRAVFRRTGVRPSLRDIRKNAYVAPRVERIGSRQTLPEATPELLGLRARILELTNIERAKFGVSPLKENSQLELAAQRYAEDLHKRNYFAHISLDGKTPKERIVAAGYGDLNQENCNCSGFRIHFGENLAKGQTTPEKAVSDWMDSPKHREALLSADFTEIGIGIFGNTWVQNFGDILVNP